MNTKAEKTNNRVDTILLTVALLISVAVITAFYYFSEQSVFYRWLGLLTGVGIAIAISLRTEKGQYFWTFIQDAQVEVQKVVWPTRQETLHTTLIVIAVVVVVALILWGVDWFLSWSIGSLMGQTG